ncbi:fascin-like [Anneissia japonica]|uniref:fascin-like n=1 Tax=Anneissia japonica TaxID=1529436 RepID=UPI0014255288|nr:fascin-like [Anneissia japonica]
MTELKYCCGLVNSDKKYLSVGFANSVNADGTSLKAKQRWNLEQGGDDTVYLKHSNFYLTTDKMGNVTCAEDKTDDAKFRVETQTDGRWAFRSVPYDKYLGCSDTVNTNATKAEERQLWTVHMDIHPQVNIRSNIRDRYAHLEDGELHFNEVIPWGADAIVTLEFHGGRYALRVCNGKYASTSGSLVDSPTDDSLFILEFHGGKAAFKHSSGKYMAAIGPKATLQCAKSQRTKPGKDEVFVLEDSHPQGILIASTGKVASTRQGVDVSAKHALDTDVEEGTFNDKETWQLEYVDGKWAVRTAEDKYWELKPTGGIQADAGSRSNSGCKFELSHHENKIALKGDNGKFVRPKESGHLYANADGADPAEKDLFIFQMVNRPQLVLKGVQGFVGHGSRSKVECSKPRYDVYKVTCKDGYYNLQAENGKYWVVEDDQSISLGSAPDKFIFEYISMSKLAIRGGRNFTYLKGEQNGDFKCNGTEVDAKTTWEV